MSLYLITAADLVNRVDSRWLGDNILDDGTSATEADLLDSSTTSGARLLELIGDASEELMAAAAVAARYSVTDLQTYGGNLLKKIVSGLTTGGVLRRRVRANKDDAEFAAMYEEAKQYCELLRRGERIFYAVPNVPEAGLPETSTTVSDPVLDTPMISAQAYPLLGPLTVNRGPFGLGPYGPCGG